MSPSGGSDRGAGSGAGGAAPAPSPSSHGSIRPPEAPKIEHFIGRRAHLQALRAAYSALLEERAACVFVRGRAGAGKSALIHHFLMGLRNREGAVVLRGRCGEGDPTPFKAFASLAGGLGRYLRRLPPEEAHRLLPRDVHALARLLPVLSGVPAVAAAPRPEEAPDAQELRRRGFAALRQLLWRISERRPLIVSVEDLQWIDADSVAWLLELLRPPNAPAMLFIGSYRTEDAAAGAPLAALLEREGQAEGAARPGALNAQLGHDVREIEVGPLDPAEAEELALALLFAWEVLGRARAGAIARASEGNPRAIEELCRAAQAGTGEVGALGEALRARLARLPEKARRLLEAVAVAGAPVDPAVAAEAAELDRDEQAAALALLRTEDLIRSRRGDGRDEVEALHDEIREALVARLDPACRQAFHRRLARALEARGGADAEALATHWEGAGEAAKAGRAAMIAADQAGDALAFERAARLYRRALSLLGGAGGADELRALAVKCGDALVNAGESAEAARVYAAAAEGAEPAQALELRRRAAEQLLRSGHIDEGLALVRAVLGAVGLSLPETPRRALLSLLLHRAELRVRGLRFHERAAADVPPHDLARIDACWSVTVGLSAVDLIRAADFSARGLLFALRAGEPYRVARALAFEASSAAMVGTGSRARAEALLGALRALSARLDSPHALGLSLLVSGMLENFAGGRWKAASRSYEQAEEVLRDRCAGVAWELVTTQLLASWARFYRGQMGALSRGLPAVIRGAEQRGDRYAVAILCAGSAWTALAVDDVAGARRAIASAMSRWSQVGFHLEHYIALLAETFVDRYAGRPGAAWKRIQERWRALERSMLLRIQNNRITIRMERASTALAVAEDAADPEPLIRLALRDAAAITREEVAWADAYAALIRAGAAALRGERPRALTLLDGAAAAFDAVDMQLYAAAARRRAGELRGGEKGLQLLLVADAYMAREEIKIPARWAAMLAPGFSRRQPAG
ncbi:MAG: AAA family ATPase [Polyangiaceae bacterium]|nr:AAA family ATPase [Polyangiaceae bacterium]